MTNTTDESRPACQYCGLLSHLEQNCDRKAYDIRWGHLETHKKDISSKLDYSKVENLIQKKIPDKGQGNYPNWPQDEKFDSPNKQAISEEIDGLHGNYLNDLNDTDINIQATILRDMDTRASLDHSHHDGIINHTDEDEQAAINEQQVLVNNIQDKDKPKASKTYSSSKPQERKSYCHDSSSDNSVSEYRSLQNMVVIDKWNQYSWEMSEADDLIPPDFPPPPTIPSPEAETTTKNQSPGYGGRMNLHVANLRPNTGKQYLYELFGNYGIITFIYSGSNFALVKFRHRSQAEEAIKHLDGRIFQGIPISVTIAKKPMSSLAQEEQETEMETDINLWMNNESNNTNSFQTISEIGITDEEDNYQAEINNEENNYQASSSTPYNLEEEKAKEYNENGFHLYPTEQISIGPYRQKSFKVDIVQFPLIPTWPPPAQAFNQNYSKVMLTCGLSPDPQISDGIYVVKNNQVKISLRNNSKHRMLLNSHNPIKGLAGHKLDFVRQKVEALNSDPKMQYQDNLKSWHFSTKTYKMINGIQDLQTKEDCQDHLNSDNDSNYRWSIKSEDHHEPNGNRNTVSQRQESPDLVPLSKGPDPKGPRGNSSEEDPDIYYYKCAFCPTKLNTMAELKNHIDSVHQHELFQFRCDTCGFKAEGPKYLRDHMRLVHNDAGVGEYPQSNDDISDDDPVPWSKGPDPRGCRGDSSDDDYKPCPFLDYGLEFPFRKRSEFYSRNTTNPREKTKSQILDTDKSN
jgi:hypothetical protein